MAQPILKPEPKKRPAAEAPDWVEAYYTPAAANIPAPPQPELTALEQMYAYYQG